MEEKTIKQILSLAIDSSRLDRIGDLTGLIKADILEYLPSEKFVLHKDWDELKNEHTNLRNSSKEGRKPPRDFKRWCELEHGAKFDELAVRHAVRCMDSTPLEFEELLGRLRDLSDRKR